MYFYCYRFLLKYAEYMCWAHKNANILHRFVLQTPIQLINGAHTFLRKIYEERSSVLSRISTAFNNASLTMATMAQAAQKSSEAPPGCTTCGRTDEKYKYQYKITDLTQDSWSPICSSCRNRIVAVCDFYNFIRHVRQGLYSSRKPQEMYIESLKLRRNMFYAKIGTRNVDQLDSALRSAGSIKPNDAFLASTMVADTLLSGKSTASSAGASGAISSERTPESGGATVKSPSSKQDTSQ